MVFFVGGNLLRILADGFAGEGNLGVGLDGHIAGRSRAGHGDAVGFETGPIDGAEIVLGLKVFEVQRKVEDGDVVEPPVAVFPAIAFAVIVLLWLGLARGSQQGAGGQGSGDASEAGVLQKEAP